jgi:hypothetical protein
MLEYLRPLRSRPLYVGRAICFLMVAGLGGACFPPSTVVEARPLNAPVASVSLATPGSVQLGQDFTFTVTFDNTGPPGDTGYGPFIDLIFPVIGVDGAGAATDDGIDFLGATYLGQPLVAVELTFPSGGGGYVNHPYAVAPGTGAPLQVCGTPGNKLVVLQLPFGSFATNQPSAEVEVSAHLSNLADAGLEAVMERSAILLEILIILLVGLAIPGALMTEDARRTLLVHAAPMHVPGRPGLIGRPPAL